VVSQQLGAAADLMPAGITVSLRKVSLRGRIPALIAAFRPSSPQDSAESRSRERYRRAFLAGIASAAARGVSILTVLISIPITLKYLGVDRFSVWMTITSLTSLLAFADFGLGNGLMNAVARCHAAGDPAGLRTYTSTALLTLGGLALFLTATALAAAPSIPWAMLLAVDARQLSAPELARVMTVFIICLAVGIPTTVVQKVQLALQLGYLARLWQLAANVAGLLALLAAVALHASLTWLVAASLGTPSLVLVLSGIIFWTRQRPAERPAVVLARSRHALELARSGGLFFVIQVAGTVAFASDTLIIAHVLNPQAVAQYSVASRLIDGLVMVSALFLTPLWPAYADALARGDNNWIRRTLVTYLGATVIVTAAMATLLVFFSRPLTLAWVGPRVEYSMPLFAACSGWAVFKAAGNALAMFLNGVGWIRFQALVAVLFACAVIPLKVVFARELGVIGVPLALALAYVILVAAPYAWRMPAMLAKVQA
jgi:O-antigen/teichoic acid export membrane protein